MFSLRCPRKVDRSQNVGKNVDGGSANNDSKNDDGDAHAPKKNINL